MQVVFLVLILISFLFFIFCFSAMSDFYLHAFVLLIYIYSRSPPLVGSHGAMVSTLDSESSDPSSNLGGTLIWYASVIEKRISLLHFYKNIFILIYSLHSIEFRGYYMAERRVVRIYILSRENKIHMFKPQCNFLSVTQTRV